MWKKVAPLAVLACLVAGCGDDTTDDSGDSPSRAGDAGAYYFEQVGAAHSENAELPGMPAGPTSLAAMLPCGKDLHTNAVTEVVVGEVSDAEEGDAFQWGDEAEVPEMLDEWSAPEADGRDILVTVTGSVLTAKGVHDPQEVILRVAVPENADPEQFLDSAGNLGDVVAFVSPRPAAPHKGDLFPALSGALVGLVDDGSVTFPAMEDGFAGDLSTTEAILSACPAD